MTSKEIEELREKVYEMSNSMLPLNMFFNDIRDNPNENYDKELAYNDLMLIVDYIIYMRNKLEKLEKANDILKDKILIYQFDNVVDNSIFYTLETNYPNKTISKEECELLREVLRNE